MLGPSLRMEKNESTPPLPTPLGLGPLSTRRLTYDNGRFSSDWRLHIHSCLAAFRNRTTSRKATFTRKLICSRVTVLWDLFDTMDQNWNLFVMFFSLEIKHVCQKQRWRKWYVYLFLDEAFHLPVNSHWMYPLFKSNRIKEKQMPA